MQAKAHFSKEDIFQKLPVPTALRKMIVPAVISQLIVLIYTWRTRFSSGRRATPTWWRARR